MVILIVIAAVIVLLVVVVATRPSDFRVTRSTTISAPPAVVFAQVNDFHNWDGWSPWARMDPEMKATYAGPAAGTGAVYSWVGNSKVGEGRMTIMESHPSDLIRIKLEFIKPFAATNTAEFTFQPQGNQTTVTWNMIGKKNFMIKAMGLVMNMDKTIGGQFDQGLAQMKSVAETAAKK
jgi:carbon monoxide dehydrogenase subunit G